jgi:hypothetical protein
VFLAFTIWHVAFVPVPAPLQPVNCAPAGGVAASVTSDACANVAERLPVLCSLLLLQMIAPRP